MPFTSRSSSLLPQHASNFALPQLTYPIDRPYRWKWLPYAAYGFMLLVLAILVPITCQHKPVELLRMVALIMITRLRQIDASQGYETVTAYKQDPNTTSVHWYHAFTGKPTPGSQCDEHLFNLGDTFVTSIGLLSYTIQTIQTDSSDGLNVFGNTTIPYKGLSTDFCDIKYLVMQISPLLYSVSGMALIECVHEDFQVSASTTHASYVSSNLTPGSDPLSYIDQATADLLYLHLQMDDQNSSSPVVGITATIECTQTLVFCPMSSIKNETNAYGPAFVAASNSSFGACTPQDYALPPFYKTSIQPVSIGAEINPTMNVVVFNAIGNYLQVLASVIRYDLGSRLPSNFLVDPSAVLSQNETFLSLDNSPANLVPSIQQAMQRGILPLAQPFNASAPNQPVPPTLSTTYACHLTVPKAIGAAVISVIVATLSIGGSIWGLLMLTAAFFAKRNRPDANYCEYHSLGSGLPKSLNASEEHLELRDKAVDELSMTASTSTYVAY